MTSPIPIGPCSPFLIVGDVSASLAHYVGKLGFECRFLATENDPFFAIVGRDSAQLFLKAVDVEPQPNATRHPWARLDAFIYVADPDALAVEFSNRGATFRQPLSDTDEGLRGFEIADPDGYVCFFGRPA